MQDLYKEQILDHWKNPRNFVDGGLGELGKGWVKVRSVNASCGDIYEMGVKFSSQRLASSVQEIKFAGEGCAISMAGFSLLGEKVMKEKMGDVNMERLLGVKVSAGRRKCLMMAGESLKMAMLRYGQYREIEKVLNDGGVIVFPTDTVWGMGALANNEKGIDRFYKLKKRDKKKPTAILVSGVDQAGKYIEVQGKALKLIEKHWPGALTVVSDGVGLRCPDDEKLRSLLDFLGEGIMAGSANVQGKRAPKIRNEVDGGLSGKVDLVLDGEAGGQEASTVVEVVSDKIRVLRSGPVKI